MTDDLDPLRRSTRDPAERGDHSDATPHASRRRLASMAAVAAAVLAVGVPIALANRPSAVPPSASTATAPNVELPAVPTLSPTSTPAPDGAPPGGAAPDGAASDGVMSAGLVAPKGMPDEDGCPVSASRLMTALLRSAVYDQIAPTKELSDVDCYGTYALGRTDPVGADPVVVVFRYSEMTDTWQAVSAGTSGYCDRLVPAAVRAHLDLCH